MIDTNVINEINYNPESADNSVHPDMYVVICDDYSKMFCVSASDVSHTLEKKIRKVVDAYNSRDKLVFTIEVVADFVNDLSDQILDIMNDLKEDKNSFEKMEISYEEKVFYDILVKVMDEHDFVYAEEKCLVLAKKIKELVDDKSQYADWSTKDDIKSQLNMDLTILLYDNGYPPEWDEEVFEKVMEQTESFKKYEVVEFTIDMSNGMRLNIEK